MKSKYDLFTRESQALFYNLKAMPIQQMLDFDYLARKTNPGIVAIIHPGRRGCHKAFFGTKEILIPIYPTIPKAVQKHPQADSLINFASFRSAYTTTKKGLETATINTIVIVAEGIPERQTKELIALAKKTGKNIIGPATVGGIVAGKFRIGYAGGTNENIITAKLYRPGSIGLVSKSGGMMNELFNMLARATDGVYEGIAIGGDSFPGSTLLDHILRYEANPNIKLIVALGELGGRSEYEIIEAKKQGKIKKPIIAWCSGTCAEIFPWEVQFGHAGAKANQNEETAAAKNKAMKEAGIIVPESFDQLEETMREAFQKLRNSGQIKANEIKTGETKVDNEQHPPLLPEREPTNFTCTISSDLGEEHSYYNIPISKIIENKYSIGEVIGLLWFKKKLPAYFSKFIELTIILCADHGPAVSGAHNAIVTSRAGKDVISSLCSGLLTIGPRFGGAIDAACRYFQEAVDNNINSETFVKEMNQKGILIPGIGHLVKSVKNPDKRVEILKRFAWENFPATPYLDYALTVEEVTVRKSSNLILNVDGCLAALFLDALSASREFTSEEINQILEIGCMDGLFALSRSIGIIGHVLDQKRLGERLYRHPTKDILYLSGDEKTINQ